MMLADVAHANDANPNIFHDTQSTGFIPPAQTNLSRIKSATELAKQRGMEQSAVAPMISLDSTFLFASLLWGSIGVGYFIYGKKQQATMPMIGGVAMVAISYVVGSWFWMSLLCVALMAAVHWLVKQGY